MCIIVYKPKESKYPSEQTLRQCFTRNPDGAGFSKVNGTTITIHKGLMTFKEFYNALMTETKENDDILMHFRITTHGGTSPSLTHPFPLTTKDRKLFSTRLITNCAVAHNGIIGLTSNAPLPHSDTTWYIKNYLTRIIKNPTTIDEIDKNIIEKTLGSKMVIQTPTKVTMIGTFEEEDGIYYSNTSYKVYKDSVPLLNNKYSYLYDKHEYESYGYDNDYWFDKCYKKQKEYDYTFTSDKYPNTTFTKSLPKKKQKVFDEEFDRIIYLDWSDENITFCNNRVYIKAASLPTDLCVGETVKLEYTPYDYVMLCRVSAVSINNHERRYEFDIIKEGAPNVQ